jgi:tetratricopeptide (TPR) repeat protein
MDPTNLVVRLCVQGMQAEASGRLVEALGLFQRAWQAAGDDYEACIAAHYVARHQTSPEETLHWSQVCLDRADRVGDGRVTGFYPSLHAGMGRAHRELGDLARAREHFALAAAHIDHVPPGQYGDWVRLAVAEGLRSTGGRTPRPVEGALAELLAKFCARADFKALGLILPAYLGDLGTEGDRVRLVTALHMVHAARWLPDDEQETVGRLVAALNDQGHGSRVPAVG